MPELNANNWKDGEVAYCRRMVNEGGNFNVPRRCVAEYLDLQLTDVIRHIAFARLHGDDNAERVAQLARTALETLQLRWARTYDPKTET